MNIIIRILSIGVGGEGNHLEARSAAATSKNARIYMIYVWTYFLIPKISYGYSQKTVKINKDENVHLLATQ